MSRHSGREERAEPESIKDRDLEIDRGFFVFVEVRQSPVNAVSVLGITRD